MTDDVPEGLVGFTPRSFRAFTPRAVQPKRLRQFYKMLHKKGFKVSFARKHIQIDCPEGSVFGPSTSGVENSWRQVKKKCLEAGVPPEVFEDGW